MTQTTTDGHPAASVLAREGGLDPAHYHHEQYRPRTGAHPAIEAFYRVKPVIPRRVQLQLRRTYARRQAARAFPAWPIEPVLVHDLQARLRAAIRRGGGAAVPILGFWPESYAAACVVTHDVEGPAGIENIDHVLELERRHGVRSCWNFVAEDYAIPPGTLERVRAAGCEVGVHGIKHDGKMFSTRERFEHDLVKIRAYLDAWDAVGFRSPATRRRAEWMHELGCLYDSSFPDTDPFEPQPGGCCSILPFMFGDVVELPLTLVQDHTLWEVLRRDSAELWLRKADWILANHGLVNINVHPDYLTTPRRLDMYEEFLAHVAAQSAYWHALPRDVARWWKGRGQLTCESDGTVARVAGADAHTATVWWARAGADDELVLEPEEPRP